MAWKIEFDPAVEREWEELRRIQEKSQRAGTRNSKQRSYSSRSQAGSGGGNLTNHRPNTGDCSDTSGLQLPTARHSVSPCIQSADPEEAGLVTANELRVVGEHLDGPGGRREQGVIA